MRHRNNVKTLGRPKAAREMLMRNLASSVIIYEKVKTTEAKAKVVKPIVENLITTARKGDLNARRTLLAYLPQELAVKKLMEVIGARYQDRPGGYTRIVKLGYRAGDYAPLVQIELV